MLRPKSSERDVQYVNVFVIKYPPPLPQFLRDPETLLDFIVPRILLI